MQTEPRLSKSTFILGLTCPRKVAYATRGYPTASGGDFAELLAEGGDRIGEVARMRYPGGRMIAERDPKAAERATAAVLREDSAVVFEAAIRSGRLFARADVLIKDGDRFDLIEVKSASLDRLNPKSYPLTTKSGGVRSCWKTIVSDIAFQRLILSRAHPDAEIACYLLCPDAGAVAAIDGLPGCLVQDDATGSPRFVGSDDQAAALTALLTLEPVDEAVAVLTPEIESAADRLAALFGEDGSVTKPDVTLGYHCRSCEFRLPKDQAGADGFRECWGALADPDPHLFDLYQLYSLGNGSVANDSIAAGLTGLADLPMERVVGPYAERQRIQIRHQLSGAEWMSDSLADALAAMPRPLHFIDFETCTPTLPEYRGMRPNETVAFQWSCHTLDDRAGSPGTLQHGEWLHDPAAHPGCPNVEFVRTLIAAVREGTVLTWTGHEAGVLAQIAKSIRERLPEEWALADEVDALRGRLVDQCEMCRQHYFHPEMGGSNSLKAVLPAVWGASAELRSHPWFASCAGTPGTPPCDPYTRLPPLAVGGEATTVKEGMGAIRAYQALLHRPINDSPAWRSLLLQYCHLDTLAMVIVWEHWRRKAKLG